MLYRSLIRPVLFRMDAERAHERALSALEFAAHTPLCKTPVFSHPALKNMVAGMAFPNPVGLAAGCDKGGRAALVWHAFGFGFLEAGTVTALPQPGNPKPRMFRYPEQEAVVNRLGFNSEGSEAVARRFALLRSSGSPLPLPVGINIGKTKVVEGEEATLEDYRASFQRLSPYADFMVVNVSSPNTPGLRLWQERDKLAPLLAMLAKEAGGRIPLFVKIAPDLNEADREDVIEIALENRLSGLIATNTTIAREGACAAMESPGGLSGKPLKERSLETLRYLSRRLEGKLPIIGVGGIASAEDAYERIKAGASLVQVYTALIYEGPFLPRRIGEGLLRLMERDGVKHISEAIGAENRLSTPQ